MKLDGAVNDYAARVLAHAERVSHQVGYTWRPARLAPSTFEALRIEGRLSAATGLPFRVSALFSDQCIVPPAVNYAFRFWHDMTHLQTGRGFDHHGEVVVGQAQLAAFEADGVRPHSVVWRLLFADTLAQNDCLKVLGRFPRNQRTFTLDYLHHGLPAAIDREAMRGRLRLVPTEAA